MQAKPVLPATSDSYIIGVTHSVISLFLSINIHRVRFITSLFLFYIFKPIDIISEYQRRYLKALYLFGNCQRPVSSLGVSPHKHKITSL